MEVSWFHRYLTCKCSVWDQNKCYEYGGILISKVVQISDVLSTIQVFWPHFINKAYMHVHVVLTCWLVLRCPCPAIYLMVLLSEDTSWQWPSCENLTLMMGSWVLSCWRWCNVCVRARTCVHVCACLCACGCMCEPLCPIVSVYSFPKRMSYLLALPLTELHEYKNNNENLKWKKKKKNWSKTAVY